MMELILKWVIVVLAVIHFGYMGIDGCLGLIKGDYIRPQSGQYAGHLGPWSQVVQKIGIDPESTFMKSLFVIWGAIGLGLAIAFAMEVTWAWKALLIFNICSLWYLGFGVVTSVLQIILLIVGKVWG